MSEDLGARGRARYAMLATVKLLAIALLLLGGCSFALVRPQPPCSRVPPYVDTAIAVVLAATVANRLSQRASDQAAGAVFGQAAAAAVGSGVFTLSAIYGFVKTSSCSAAP